MALLPRRCAWLPLSATCTPAMIFISVLLPAPFSPTRPWISPLAQREVDAAQRLHAAEGFGDLDELQEGAWRAATKSASRCSKGDQIR